MRAKVPAPALVKPLPVLPFAITELTAMSVVTAVESLTVKVRVPFKLSVPPEMLPTPGALLTAAAYTTLPPRFRTPPDPIFTVAVLPAKELPADTFKLVMVWVVPFRSSVPATTVAVALLILPDPLNCSVPAVELSAPLLPTCVVPV